MKPVRSSLLGRIALGFTAVYVVVGFLVVLLIEFASSFDPFWGADAVATRLAAKLHHQADGTFLVADDPVLADIARDNPNMWYVARIRDQTLVVGPAPAYMVSLVQNIAQESIDDILVTVPLQGPSGVDYATAYYFGDPSGYAVVAVGGIDKSSLGLSVRLARWSFSPTFLFVLFMALAGLVIVGFVSALALRALRPLAQAIQDLDAEDLSARLSVPGLVRELQPIVSAFNAILSRLETVTNLRRRFMADVAHEFRTPLAVLSLHAETLPETSAKADIQRGLFRLSQMIGQMLDSERIKSSRPANQALDLVQLSKSALADIAPVAVDAGYELAFECDADRVEVLGDERAIRRALTNLLGNAVAHAGGRGTISVSVSRAGWVEVRDEGPGLAKDAGERVFEPFHRERWDLDGCGLGLHLVREIMHAHGGAAELIKGEGGATFRLTFSRNRIDSHARQRR